MLTLACSQLWLSEDKESGMYRVLLKCLSRVVCFFKDDVDQEVVLFHDEKVKNEE